MRNVRRRTVLTAAGVTGLAIALPPPQLAVAEGTPDDASQDVTLRENIVGRVAGTDETNASAAVQQKLTHLYGSAQQNLEDLLSTPSTELFPGLPLGTDEVSLSTTFEKLYEIAVATAMPVPSGASVPSDLSGNRDAAQQVISGLRWVYDHHFQDQEAGYYGNWFHWEIGSPAHISQTLVLLREELESSDPELAQQYVDSMDLYLRNGKDGDVDLDSRFHTGANLVDITTNRIVQGAAVGDKARITTAIADQLTAFQPIDPYHLDHGVTDGFYADGSFLMHSSVAYTGSYGVGLLGRATTTITLLKGTPLATDQGLQERLNGWLATSFGPLIAEGWMMEIVKGRSVSRPATGYRTAADVVESVVALSRHSSAGAAADLTAYVAHLQGIAQMSIEPDAFTDPANIARYARIAADDTIAPADIVPAEATFAYNAMDRHVHHRPGFTFALARSSERVSKYEYMLGENLRPWFQGDGAHYLHLTGDDQGDAFGVDYFTAVDPERLGGVTAPLEERRTVPELYGQQFYDNPAAGFTSSSEKQNQYVYFPLGTNAFSGGSTLGTYAVAGMQQADDAAYVAKQAGDLPEDFVAYANCRSSKSWFMFDDEVVVLASGISDEHDRPTVTTIDSRISAPEDTVELLGETRDGSAVNSAGPVTDLSWLLYVNATRGTSIGYVFYTDHEIDVRLREVRRPRSWIRTANSDRPIPKTVFDLSHTRGGDAPPGSMAYSIVPGATAEQLAAHGARGPEVVLHGDDVHAVRHPRLGLLALNTFSEGTHEIGNLTVHGPASVITQDGPRGSTVIAISDPTFARDTVSITIRGRRPVLESDQEVTARTERGHLRLDVRTHHAYGKTFTVTVDGGGIV